MIDACDGLQTFYPGLRIPEGRSGKVHLRHHLKGPDTTLSMANSRTPIIGGHEREDVSFSEPTIWHELSEDEQGVWMTDLPIEQAQADHQLDGIDSGRVLVGGLGLGYAMTQIAQRPDVDEVVVVENSHDVVAVVWDHVRTDKCILVEGDLFEFLRESDDVFDFGFFDIWQSDGETTFHEQVVPLRRLAAGSVDHVVCWNEDVMRGQLFLGIVSKLQLARARDLALDRVGAHVPSLQQLATRMDDRDCGAVWVNWCQPFFEAVRAGRLREPEHRAAALYAAHYGIVEAAPILRKLLSGP